MARHNDFGRSGEDLAAAYLQDKGYTLLDRNWYSGHRELDIVAMKDDCLVIVEVKTRRSATYGRPEQMVTESKIKRTVLAADAYVRFHRYDLPVRFDIIAVTGMRGYERIEHFEDAFRSPICLW